MSAQPCLRVLRRGVSELSTTLWWHVRMWAHCLVGASPPMGRARRRCGVRGDSRIVGLRKAVRTFIVLFYGYAVSPHRPISALII